MSLHAELIARLRETLSNLHADFGNSTTRYDEEVQSIRDAIRALERGDTEQRAAFEAGYKDGHYDALNAPWLPQSQQERIESCYQQSRTGEKP